MNQLQLLRDPQSAPLFWTAFLGAFNDNVYKTALGIFIAFDLASANTRNGTLLVVLAGGIFILPFFLFSAIAGQLADKFEKSMLIRKIKLAEIGIMVAGALGFYLESISLLMALLFLMGTQSTAFGPIKYAILPQYFDQSELTAGNGVMQMGTFLAILLGIIAGGSLVAFGTLGPALVGVTTVVVAVLGWVTSCRIPVAVAPAPELELSFNLPRQTVRILQEAARRRDVWLGVVSVSWFWFVGATFISLVPTYTPTVLGGNEQVATLLLAAFSIGIGAGSLLCARLSPGRIELGLVPIGAIGISMFSADLYWVGQPEAVAAPLSALTFLKLGVGWRVFFDLVMIGLCGGLYIVPSFAMVQNRSDPAHRARIIAANNIMNALLMVASALLTMMLIQFGLTIVQLFLTLAVLNVLITLTVFLYSGEHLPAFVAWLRRLHGRG